MTHWPLSSHFFHIGSRYTSRHSICHSSVSPPDLSIRSKSRSPPGYTTSNNQGPWGSQCRALSAADGRIQDYKSPREVMENQRSLFFQARVVASAQPLLTKKLSCLTLGRIRHGQEDGLRTGWISKRARSPYLILRRCTPLQGY